MSAREYDTNGWFEVANNPISRIGVFPYSGAQIGAPASRAGEIFQVLRPPEELSDPEAVASFRLMPIIDDHTMLGDSHTAPEDKGVAGVIGEGLRYENGTLLANLKIFGKALAEKIKQGKTELSCGYRCVYEFTSGVWEGQKYDAIQRRIRGNHLAVVDEGRMGPEVAILDHMIFTVDAKDTAMDIEELKKMIEEVVAKVLEGRKEEAEVKIEDQGGEEEAKAKAVADEEAKAKTAADEEAAKAEVKAADEEVAKAETEAMDAKIKALTSELAEVKSRPAMDEAAIFGAIKAKTDLVNRMLPHVGAFDSAAMTLDDVAKYGVKKLAIKNVPAGHEAIALDAYLQASPAPVVRTAQDSAKTSALGQSLSAYATGKK